MKNIKLLKLWDSLHSSYWFVPTLMVIAAIGLAFTMVWVDRSVTKGLIERLSWIYSGGPEGARLLLSTVAGSMITVAGTTFSIVIVAFTLASSQFGPRLLRNFMQDTGNQVVLGTFVATFIYSLLVLRTVRGEENTVFVPQLAVTCGIGLAIASIGVLIYFIHHASTLIQASHVISEVGKDLDQAIDHLFPHQIGQAISDPSRRRVDEIPVDFDQTACSVLATHSGYIQAIDNERLINLAKRYNLLLRLSTHPGRFVVRGSELLRAWPGQRFDQKLIDQFNDAFILGKQRTEQEDIEFPIDQLVEIAIRAISPAVNDPFTAIRCIDQLSSALCGLAEREFPSPYRHDDSAVLRVIAELPTFPDLLDTAFNQIRQYSSSDVSVRIRLLEAIATIASYTRNPKDQAALKRHAEMIQHLNPDEISEKGDREAVRERYLTVVKQLERVQL